MITIWRFPLDWGFPTDALLPSRPIVIHMPFQARVRHLAVQKGVPCIWAEVWTPVRIREDRSFEIMGTGERHPMECPYIGTFVLDDAGYVGHVYETTLR